MGIFRLFRRKDSPDQPNAGGHAGYFPLQDTPGRSLPDDDDDDVVYRAGTARPAWDEWDARLDRIDHSLGKEERKRQRWWQRSYWQGRRKRWWVARSVAAVLGLFILLVAWLAITAPLSKSLQPIAPPQVTLLAADGTPIARNGAVVEAPVEVAKLPPHVVEAFIATEDRRFYSHWGVDPRGIARARGQPHRRTAGRQHDHPAARQIHLPDPRTQPDPQGARGADRVLARGLADQGRDPRTLPVERLFRRQHATACAPPALHYFYRQPEKLTPEPGGDAGRAAAGAVGLCPDRALSTAPRGACGSCSGRWSTPDT